MRDPAGLFARTWIPGAETAEAFDLAGEPLGTLDADRRRRACSRGRSPASVSRSATRRPAAAASGRSRTRTASGPSSGPVDDVLMAAGQSPPVVRQVGRASDHATKARTASTSRSGRPMRSACRWSEISTTGTGVATSCAGAAMSGCGRYSSPISARAAATSSRSWAPTAIVQTAEGRSLSPSPPNCVRRPPQSRRPPRAMSGRTTRTARTGPGSIRGACRSASTRCMPDRGTATSMAGSSAGTRWPTD